MQTFLGMQLFPKRKSDEEYLQHVRKTVEGWKRWRWRFRTLVIGTSLCGTFGIIWAAQEAFGLLRGWQGLPGVEALWLLLGFFMGHMLTHFLHIVVFAIGEMCEMRTARLLIHYHDAYQNLAADAGSSTDDLE